MDVWTCHGTGLLGEVYGRSAYWTEHEAGFGKRKANFFWQKFYHLSLVVNGKFCERSNGFLQGALLKTIFSYDLLIVALHHLLAVILLFEATFEEIGVEVVSVAHL